MDSQVVWLVVILTTFFDLPSFKSQDLLALRSYCGFQRSDDYVRDNDNITMDEYPWLAQILYGKDKKILCVGSLINSRYVLTAGHCRPMDKKITGVRFGDYDVTTDRDCTNHTKFGVECSDPVQEFDVEELIRHPYFSVRTNVNDIALIRLSRNVDYSDFVRPICLPSSNFSELEDGEQLAVSGWGLASVAEGVTKIKKKILGSLVSSEKCRSIYNGYRKPITLDNLCVIEDQESSVCQAGDSGGPLMKSVKRQWYQVGLVSFGIGCFNKYPTVYTKVSRYLEWIKDHLRK